MDTGDAISTMRNINGAMVYVLGFHVEITMWSSICLLLFLFPIGKFWTIRIGWATMHTELSLAEYSE
jgi:hypothetical protein